MDRGLGEGTQVPGRRAVVAPQGFAPVQPRERSVEKRWATHLAPVMGRRVPLHRGSDRVAIIGRDVIPLSVDVKKYIHLLGQRVLSWIHVGMAEPWVV